MHSPHASTPIALGLLCHLVYMRSYDSVPRNVSQARKDLVDRARRARLDDDLVETLALLVSELATNAVEHASSARERPVFTVWLQFGDLPRPILRLQVFDHDTDHLPSLPRPVSASDLLEGMDWENTCGRGLAMVATMTKRCGVTIFGDAKCVWCEVPIQQMAPARSLRTQATSRTPPLSAPAL